MRGQKHFFQEEEVFPFDYFQLGVGVALDNRSVGIEVKREWASPTSLRAGNEGYDCHYIWQSGRFTLGENGHC